MSGLILSAAELNSSVNRNSVRIDEPKISETALDSSVEHLDEKNKSSQNAIGNHLVTDSIVNDEETNTDDNSNVDIATNDLDCGSIRNRSPTGHSVGSNNISIATLDDDDSSVVDSDSDPEDVINGRDHRSPSGVVLVNRNEDSTNSHQSSILCANNDIKPNIGSIAVQNSSDITFGNKTFYQGPVTIKQFVYDKNKWKETDPSEKDNLGYVNSSTDKLGQTQKNVTEYKDHPDELDKKWKCSNKQTTFSAILAAGLVSLLVILILVVKYSTSPHDRHTSKKIGDGDDSRLNQPISSSIGSDIITDTAGPLRIISRSEWIAQPPSNELTPLELPSKRVIIAHTATENCTTQASCTYQVRLIQTFHIESRGWDDIGYNFLVGGDGAVYVGRGWDLQGAHTKGYNVKSICIAFIGTFNKVEPPKRQLLAAQKMMEEGVKLGKLTKDYALYGHRQLIASESPGLALYEILKRWDHWTKSIVNV